MAAEVPGQPAPFTGASLERAARLLLVRSRREAAGGLAGGYRSAFRGGGVEFEESRPYVPGDDVRFIDWNAMARTGSPYVKRYREERDQTLILALDVSRSMGFGTVGPGKAAAAAHAAALLTSAAVRAGDRVGLLCFDRRIRTEIPPGRGTGHSWRILRALVSASHESSGGTNLGVPLARIRAGVSRRAVVVLISDFRDEGLFDTDRGTSATRAELIALARRHDVVALMVHDPREEAIPRVGRLRVVDAETPGRALVLRSRTTRARGRYQVACQVRRQALVRRFRGDGVDVLALRSDRDPLRALAHFFERHGAKRPRRLA